jgi:hypothetical protein
MKHPNRRKVELKQHTPLIHFQHGQEGATLRASDLKPKLDRYLLNKLPDYQKYLVGGGFADPDHQALDYKVHIVAEGKSLSPIIKGERSIPMFFANMGDDFDNRGLVTHRRVSLEFHSFYPALLDAIELNIGAFFTCTNFGMRSTKGFGSFTVENDPAVPVNAYWFETNTRDWRVVFFNIELFYKSVRGGINGIQSPNGSGFARDFYMKPLLFSYARSKGIKWEKKAIKERRPFDDVLRREQEDRARDANDADKPNWPLWVAEPNERIVRDVLGLSTDQSWKGYPGGRNGATITKEDTQQRIERFPSPLIFKPIQTSNGYRIYFWGEPIPSAYLNSSFNIKVNQRPIGQFSMWKEFDLQDFLKNFLNTQNARAAMRYNPNDSRQKSVADTLLNIYSAIEKNRT